MLALTISLLAFAPQGGGVVINEFSYDDSGTDDREFVELYNASGEAVDIGDWVLDSEDQNGPNTPYTIPTGTMLAAGDYYVLGSNLVPNVDLVVGTTNIWENDQESLTLRDAGGTVVDTLVYEANKGLWPTAMPEGEGVWGNFTSIDGIETSWSRLRDGQDTDNNGRDFRLAPSTPGESNDIPSILTYGDDFDAATPGGALAEWGGSFVLAHAIDPTVADSLNPNAIPASPQGGNAAIFWDPSGGGNANMLLTDATDGVVFEAFVYFDAALEPAGEREVWSVGLQGTTGTFYNFPDPSGTAGFTANGNTGVNWTFEVTDTAATLYLVDDNDGGLDHVVLGQIAIRPGVNDGWQRLRLHANAGMVEGRFGGTFGMNDGQSIAAPIDGAVGGIWVGYREFIVANATARPFTCDGIRVSGACSDLTVEGDGSPRSELRFALSAGEPKSLAVLFLGEPGSTTLSLGKLGTLELGLAWPFLPLPMGFTDEHGNEELTLRLPRHLPPQAPVFGQATTIGLSHGHGHGHHLALTFCPSDVEGFTIGQ